LTTSSVKGEWKEW